MGEAKAALKKYFGFDSFREGQCEIIEDLLKGRDTIAMLPTGGGKSMCYQLPGYIKDGSVIIVTPLLALMEDQVAQLKMAGEKKAVALNSFLTLHERSTVLDHLSEYRFIFLSPESLRNSRVMSALKSVNVSLFAVDEAHCISQWGHDFRPDYSMIGKARAQLNKAPCLAMTATATIEVIRDIKESLQMENAEHHLYSVNRPNISLAVKKMSGLNEKLEELVSLAGHLKGPGLIYCAGRQWTEKTAAYLKDHGLTRTAYYHGGMENEQRMLIQQQFLNGQLDLVCCTNAFGMGVNKNDIRFVLHFHMPARMDSYMQEIGRAGRDGLPAIAVTLFDSADIQLPLFMIEREFPEREDIRAYLRSLAKDSPYRLELEETHQRFIDHYATSLHGVDAEEKTEAIWKKIQQRQQIKSEKLKDMVKWYSTDGCRRSGILAHFGEKSDSPAFTRYCCDYCGMEESSYYGNTGHSPSINEAMDWENELKTMFKVSEPLVQKSN
ncbi:RecQ family ATP-dependent DNA helicase [Metabacillus sp. 84]|uniref:RecQ family ATP-dependent DNA helicase n=1 Tax=unclassified Metabacillus TaxID=2675274 RepID=UPI003CF78E8C